MHTSLSPTSLSLSLLIMAIKELTNELNAIYHPRPLRSHSFKNLGRVRKLPWLPLSSPPLSLSSRHLFFFCCCCSWCQHDSEESEGEKEKRAASIKYPGTEQREAGEEEMVERSGENGVAAPVAVEEVAAAAGAAAVEDPRLQGISAAIRVVPHFPKPGIMFNDITTLLLRPKVFKDAVDILVDRYRDMAISAVAGIEARGFIFGPPVALALGAKFVPLRKPKKLPGEVISENYVLEYGTDCLEMHVGAVQPEDRVLVIDDLVATGGTLCAAIKLIEHAEAEVVECACIIGLPKFKGRCQLSGKPVYILVECRQ